jgi:micrococcal nuclease
MPKKAFILAQVALFFIGGINMYPKKIMAQDTLKARIMKVIDGDTFDFILDGETYRRRGRLLCVDSPERGQCYYDESRLYLAGLIENRDVVLLLYRNVSLGRHIVDVLWDNRSIGYKLLSGGYVFVYPEYCRNEDFYILEERNRNKRLGVWGCADLVFPWESRKRKP